MAELLERPAAVADTGRVDVSFGCTACGRCCNSPPELTLPELFTHSYRFIGTLAIARLARPDGADAQALAERLGGQAARAGFVLRTQGHDYASRGHCPALGEAGRCMLHGADKPTACASVPLDAALPDRLQPVVLRRRATAATFGEAACIAFGPREGHTPWVVDGRLTDGAHRADLDARRAALAAEVALWGDALFARIGPALRLRPPAPGGFLALPLVPVLDLLPDRDEARAYARAQRALIGREVASALARRQSADRATTRELRAFDAAYAAWLSG